MRNLSIVTYCFLLSAVLVQAGNFEFPVVVNGDRKPEEQGTPWQHRGRQVVASLNDNGTTFMRLAGSGSTADKCGGVTGYNLYSLTDFSTAIGTLALDATKSLTVEIKCRIIDSRNIENTDGQNIIIYYGGLDDGEAGGSFRHSIGFAESHGVKKVRLSIGKEYAVDWSKWHSYIININSATPNLATFIIKDAEGKIILEVKDMQTGDTRRYPYGDVGFGDGDSQTQETVWDVAYIKIDQQVAAGQAQPANNAASCGNATSPSAETISLNNDVSQFFIDDYLIENTGGITRKMKQAKKVGSTPVLKFDRPWENQPTCSFVSVIREGNLYKMWYWTGGIEESRKPGSKIRKEDNSFICYATSDDGIHWKKPKLGIIEFNSSRDNNIVLRHHGSHVDAFSVLVAPWETDPQKKYRMTAYIGTWPYQGGYKKLGYKYPPGHFLYYSADGINWRLAQENPIAYLEPQDRENSREIVAFDASTFCVDQVRRKYVGFLKGMYQGKRARFYTQSDDAVNWSNPELCICADKFDARPETQIYNGNGFPYESIWLGLAMLYYPGTTETMDDQLVYSRDGRKWFRSPIREPFIALGATGTWDSKMIWVSSTCPVSVGDELWFYYGGLSIKHNLTDANNRNPQWGAIGLAKIKRDRFVAMVAKNKGFIQTKPFKCQGGELEINCIGGSLKVEVLDADGKVMPEYSAENCQTVSGDCIAQKIRWKSADKLPAAKIRLKFILEKSEIYSFRIEGK